MVERSSEEIWQDIAVRIELGRALRIIVVECVAPDVERALFLRLLALGKTQGRRVVAEPNSGCAIDTLQAELEAAEKAPEAEEGALQAVRAVRVPEPAADAERWALQRMNENRDNLRSALRGTLILVGGPDFLRRFPSIAPDLWSVRAEQYELTWLEPPGEAEVAGIEAAVVTEVDKHTTGRPPGGPLPELPAGYLPPLTKVVPEGKEGEDEMLRLLRALIEAHAAKHGFGLIESPLIAFLRDGEMIHPLGYAPDGGVPGVNGSVAFEFGGPMRKLLLSSEETLREASMGSRLQWRSAVRAFVNKAESFRIPECDYHIRMRPAGELGPSSGDQRAAGDQLSWGPLKLQELLSECPALLARYYPSEGRRLHLVGYQGTEFDGVGYRELDSAYRRRVSAASSSVRTLGLPPETLRERHAAHHIPLREVFVPQQFQADVEPARGKDSPGPTDGDGERDGRVLDRSHSFERAAARPPPLESSNQMDGPREISDGDPARQALTLAGLLATERNVVVLGDPGTGKTTLLKFLALLHAGGAALAGFGPDKRIVPLFVSLRDLAQAQKEHPEVTLLDYLEIQARKDYGLPRAHRVFFEAALRMGDALVLLDGLDEVGRDETRLRIAAQVRALQAEFPHNRFWVTSRIYGYGADVELSRDRFRHVRVGRLEPAQIDEFVARWYATQESASTAQEQLVRSLQEAIRRTPSVARLAGNPLLLTLMAFIHHGLRKLPHDRGELYEKCVEMLLKTWQQAKRGGAAGAEHDADRLGLHVHTQKDYLAHLAMHLQEKGSQGGEDDDARGLLPRTEAIEVLARRHLELASRERPHLGMAEAREEMVSFFDYVSEQTGLLIDKGGDQVGFIHLSFQEYLAAWVFTCKGGASPELFEERLGDPAWEEVLLLRLYIVLRTPGGGGERAFDAITGAILRHLERNELPEGWLTLTRALRDNLGFRAHDRRAILERALGYWLEHPMFAGPWFNVLEELSLFAGAAREDLRTLLLDAVGASPPATSVACLHLAARLFGFPAEAVERLRHRPELNEPRSPSALAPAAPAAPTRSGQQPTPTRKSAPAEPEILFSWLHLSDIHIGHGSTSHRWDQELVLDALLRDVRSAMEEGRHPKPDVVLVTGDVAFSGKKPQYTRARDWLSQLTAAAQLDLSRVLVVPGNHDVDREADKDRATARLVRMLREGHESLDDALANEADRELLARRMMEYLAFAVTLGPAQPVSGSSPSRNEDQLFWSHRLLDRGGKPVHLVGLNTALLAADDRDKGRLRIGKEQLTKTLKDSREDELTIVLTHHPLQEGWVHDEREADGWIRSRAHLHLSGHVHDATTELLRSGSGNGFIRIVAGAAHGDASPPGVPASHGYSAAAVLRAPDGRCLLRVWPRRWSERNKDFRVDGDSVPPGREMVEQEIHRLSAKK